MDDHSRTIIHIDIDCFYAQVEMVENPSLKNKPLGIRQKNFIVTSNYIAREYGIKKGMYIQEVKELCPNVVLVNGEDLYKYRQVSNKITSIVSKFCEKVERLGLDENYIDVSEIVKERLKNSSNSNLVGYTFGETEVLCDCGCTERICVGTQIAQEIRERIYEELQLTVCAGIAHNKLLAKIVGKENKPNKQTCLFPNSAPELMLSLELVKNIPSIGQVTSQQLKTIGISTIRELQFSSIDKLKTIFTTERAESIWNLGYGIDNSDVRKTGKPQSIGLEDSSTCKAITTENEVKDKFRWLLGRLIKLVDEDGRIPNALKITVRTYDGINLSTSVKETKQCNMSCSLKDETKIMNIIMTQFRKIVKGNKFFITLLGLSVTKFTEKINSKNILPSFFSQQETIIKKPKSSTLAVGVDTPEHNIVQESSFNEPSISHSSASGSNSQQSPSELLCPPDVDKEVFRELPKDIQEELWNTYKRKRENSEVLNTSKRVKSNSILNYFVKK